MMKLAPPVKSVTLSLWNRDAIVKNRICIATVTIALMAKLFLSIRGSIFNFDTKCLKFWHQGILVASILCRIAAFLLEHSILLFLSLVLFLLLF